MFISSGRAYERTTCNFDALSSDSGTSMVLENKITYFFLLGNFFSLTYINKKKSIYEPGMANNLDLFSYKIFLSTKHWSQLRASPS